MRITTAHTVSNALLQNLTHIHAAGREQPSRNGPVLVLPGPLAIYGSNRRIAFCTLA